MIRGNNLKKITITSVLIISILIIGYAVWFQVFSGNGFLRYPFYSILDDTIYELAVVLLILLLGMRFRNTGFLLVVAGVFLYVHEMILPFICAVLYMHITMALGIMVSKLLKAKHTRMFDLFVGIVLLVNLYAILSLFKIGSIQNIRIAIVVLSIILFIANPMKVNERVQNVKTFFSTVFSKEEYIYISVIVFFVLIHIGRANVSLDYDSVWYGLRAPFVLDNSNGIFEDLKLNGIVYFYSKAFETYMLPLSFEGAYGFFLAGNIVFSLVVICFAYLITKEITSSRKYALVAASITSMIPGIMNMSETAKSDIFTLMIQLLFLYIIVVAVNNKQPIPVLEALSIIIFTQVLKPTALVFSGMLFASLFVLIVFRYRKVEIRKSSIFYLIISCLSVFFMWFRSYILTGMPANQAWGIVFRLLGFEYKYPYGAQTLAYKDSENAGLIDMVEKVLRFFVLPQGDLYDHVILAWPTAVMFVFVIFAIIGLFVIKRNDTCFFVKLAFTFELFAFFVSLFFLRKADGNYFMLFYAIAIILGTAFLSALNSMDLICNKGILYLFQIVIILSGFIITISVNWSWTSGLSEINLLNTGSYNHQEAYRQTLKQQGCDEIYSILTSDKHNRVLAYGVHPDIEQIPCVIETTLDISYWGGRPDFFETESAYVEFMEYQDYDYILITPDSISGDDQSYKDIMALIDRGDISNLIFENDFVLLEMGECTSNEAVRTDFMELFPETGKNINSASDVQGIYEDGWCTDEVSFCINSGNGEIYFSLVFPIEGEQEEMLEVYINDEISYSNHVCNDMEFTVNTQEDQLVKVTIKCNYSLNTENGDTRTLCYMIRDISSN